VVEWINEAQRAQIAELHAAGASSWRMRQETGLSRHAVLRQVRRLKRKPKPEPVRSPLRLSLAEREEISRGLVAGESLRSIAGRLGRSPSTVSREVRRHGGARKYRAVGADRAAVRSQRRPKRCKIALSPRLREAVEEKLELEWSPQQISGWLVAEFPDDPEMRVSHETIYLSLFIQARGALRKELARHLRTRRATRRPLGHSVMNGQGQLRDTVHISERPAEADDRAVPGHWEGDLVFGKGMTAIATLVERKTRFVMLVALPNGHTADVVAEALAAKVTELPAQLRRSLTWDHGKEMARHATFSVATAVMPLPKIRSPSQWPGTARSFASAGRSRMLTVPVSWP
jgi:IS30 family transposase